MKKNIVKIGILLMVMMCMFNIVVNAGVMSGLPEARSVNTLPNDALIGPTNVQTNPNNATIIIIRAIQALLPILVLLIAVIRLLINLSKIKKAQNEEEKAKKKTRTIIELCIWIGILFLIFMLSPMLSIYINMNRTIM